MEFPKRPALRTFHLPEGSGINFVIASGARKRICMDCFSLIGHACVCFLRSPRAGQTRLPVLLQRCIGVRAAGACAKGKDEHENPNKQFH
jgi:hypothetical protein